MSDLQAFAGCGSPAPRQAVLDQKFGLYFQYKLSFSLLYLCFCLSFKIPSQPALLGKLADQIQPGAVLVKHLLTLS